MTVGHRRLSSRKTSIKKILKGKDHRPVQSAMETCWETFQPQEELVEREELGLQKKNRLIHKKITYEKT
jgi:hypothetical protein